MAKAKFKKVADFENGTVDITVIDSGETLHADMKELSDETIRNCVVYCMNDRLPGAVSGSKVAPLAAMTAMWDNMKAGVWSKKGEGINRITLLVEALMSVTGQAQEEVEKKLEDLKAADEANGTKDVAKLKSHPDIKAAIGKINAARATARAKTDKEAAKGNETPLQF